MTEINHEYLKIDHITKTYGVVKALRDVSFSVREGEIHTILGENGAGKSTLVKIMTGEASPDTGAIHLMGEAIATYKPAVAHQMGIYMVHQELAVFENLTVAENIYPYYTAGSKHISYAQLYADTQKQLDLFGIKTIRPDQPLASLTLAGQQMVEILRCIVANPKVLILDEPTSGLNDSEAELLMKILIRLKNEGLTIIYISHRLNEIMQISDRITVLRDGEFVATLENDDDLTETDLINSMVGRNLSSLYGIKQQPGDTNGEVLLEVQGLHKTNALLPTDLTVKSGEIVGIFGLEGSGTNKLSRMMYGLERSEGGKVSIRGKKVEKLKPAQMVLHKVMYLNNNRKNAGLLLDMPVSDNVSLPILRKVSKKLGFIAFKQLDGIATKFIKMFSVALPSLTTRPRNLSGGNQQKVMLSMCLAPEPEILIANEPTRGIDVGAKAEIHKFLLELASQGVGIVLFSSELPELMTLSDRILVMRNNGIVGEVPCGEFSEQTIMRYAAAD